jgi:hypothetical protein
VPRPAACSNATRFARVSLAAVAGVGAASSTATAVLVVRSGNAVNAAGKNSRSSDRSRLASCWRAHTMS